MEFVCSVGVWCSGNIHAWGAWDAGFDSQYPDSADEGPLAQLVERIHGMDEVSGSIPLWSTRMYKSFLKIF